MYIENRHYTDYNLELALNFVHLCNMLKMAEKTEIKNQEIIFDFLGFI